MVQSLAVENIKMIFYGLFWHGINKSGNSSSVVALQIFKEKHIIFLNKESRYKLELYKINVYKSGTNHIVNQTEANLVHGHHLGDVHRVRYSLLGQRQWFNGKRHGFWRIISKRGKLEIQFFGGGSAEHKQSKLARRRQLPLKSQQLITSDSSQGLINAAPSSCRSLASCYLDRL